MKFTPSIMGAASGKLGGIVASRNKGGQYFRRNSMPTNPQTSRQTTNRNRFATWTQLWNTTDEANRVSWDVYAANVTFLDSLGQPLILSGQQAFMRSNQAAVDGGPGPFEAAPVVYNLGEPVASMTQLTLGASAGQVDWTFTVAGSGTSEEGALAVYISRPQNVGKTFFKGPYQLAFLFTNVNLLDVTLTGDDTPTLMDWQLNEDDYVHVRARLIYADGRIPTTWQGWRTVGPNVP